MNVTPYIVGSGFIGGNKPADDFYETRNSHLERNGDFKPEHMYVICARGESPPDERDWITKIKLKGDLGHICRDSSQKHQIEGWPMVVMTTAMIAYQNECDFIFIEQDCLPFGPFISKMYEEIREGVGLIMGNTAHQPCAQSLFLLRHWFIPEFVWLYLGMKLKDRKQQGEQAFVKMEGETSGKVQRFSFGFDRDRPPEGFASMKDKVWYLQQISVDELTKLKESGFIV